MASDRRTRVFRLLVSAVPAVCLIVCVLLVALWVGSYWRLDQFVHSVSATEYVAYTSAQGRIHWGKSNDPRLSAVFGTGWSRRKSSLSNWQQAGNVAYFPATVAKARHHGIFPLYSFRKDFVLQPAGTSYEVILPYWLIVVLLAVLAALPWPPWRFSLRTLLIATTLFAVVLGLVVWAAN
jgi:hypothetical protein